MIQNHYNLFVSIFKSEWEILPQKKSENSST